MVRSGLYLFLRMKKKKHIEKAMFYSSHFSDSQIQGTLPAKVNLFF